MNLSIPIYRAKKINSNEYVEGSYINDKYQHFILDCGLVNIVRLKFGDYAYHEDNFVEIDPTTLSIHFPDMLDSEGNKIFASLSEDGKGGDITKTRDGKNLYRRVHMIDDDGTLCGRDIETLERFKKRAEPLNLKVLEIQQ